MVLQGETSCSARLYCQILQTSIASDIAMFMVGISIWTFFVYLASEEHVWLDCRYVALYDNLYTLMPSDKDYISILCH